MKARVSGNCIRDLKVNGDCAQTPVEVRRPVVEYFTNQVMQDGGEHPRLDGVRFKKITEVVNVSLVEPFTRIEIEEVMKESDGNKSLGPNSFNFAFIKSLVKIMFDQFHANEVILKSLLAYFVTLIPKVSSLMSSKEFRSISLLGSLYKLLAKVLARRLANVMDSNISMSQSAFVKGRNLVDGVLVANEMVNFTKKTKKECLVLKVDFEKAFDPVDWGVFGVYDGEIEF